MDKQNKGFSDRAFFALVVFGIGAILVTGLINIARADSLSGSGIITPVSCANGGAGIAMPGNSTCTVALVPGSQQTGSINISSTVQTAGGVQAGTSASTNTGGFDGTNTQAGVGPRVVLRNNNTGTTLAQGVINGSGASEWQCQRGANSQVCVFDIVNESGTETWQAGITDLGGNYQIKDVVNAKVAFSAQAGATPTASFNQLTTNGPLFTSGGTGLVNSEALLAIARGGTNANATPTNGGSAYGTGSAYAFTAAGTTGQVLISQGAAAPIWSGREFNFEAYNQANLAATKIISQTVVTNASTLVAGSNMTTVIAGAGTGTFVIKLCSDAATCGAGNIYLTCTSSANCATETAGTVDACTITKSAVAAATTLTWSVTTACGTTDPGTNLVAHFTTP